MNPIYESIVNKNTDAQAFISDLISDNVYSRNNRNQVSVDVLFVSNTMSIVINREQGGSADFIGSQSTYQVVRKVLYLYLIELSLICNYTECISNTQSTLEVRDKSNYTLTIL